MSPLGPPGFVSLSVSLAAAGRWGSRGICPLGVCGGRWSKVVCVPTLCKRRADRCAQTGKDPGLVKIL